MALTFVVFEMAFDSIYPIAVIEVLTNQGIEKPFAQTLTNIYREFFTIEEVRQGDAVSSKLFTVTLENILRRLEQQSFLYRRRISK